jgi:hypothetical protein
VIWSCIRGVVVWSSFCLIDSGTLFVCERVEVATRISLLLCGSIKSAFCRHFLRALVLLVKGFDMRLLLLYWTLSHVLI